jgi:hypothetical protein
VVPVRKRNLFGALAVAGLAVAGIGVYGYAALVAAGEKSKGELLLFAGVAGLLLIAYLALAVARSSRRVREDFDRIIEGVRHNGLIQGDRLLRLGWLGEKIGSIFSELSEGSERKSARIASLSAIVRLLSEFISDPVLTVDLSGNVRWVSAGFMEKRDSPLPDPAKIEDLLPGLNFAEAATSVDRSHGPVEASYDGGIAVIYPVFSMRNDMSHLIVDLSPQKKPIKAGAYGARIDLVDGKPARKPFPLSFLFRKK